MTLAQQPKLYTQIHFNNESPNNQQFVEARQTELAACFFSQTENGWNFSFVKKNSTDADPAVGLGRILQLTSLPSKNIHMEACLYVHKVLSWIMTSVLNH